jgi:hypothetical protein
MPSLSQFRRSSLARWILVAWLEAMFVLIAGASAWHPLHEWLHPDAGHEDHECAVTLFHAGGVDSAAAPLVNLSSPTPIECGDVMPPEEVREIGVRREGVLEHAPPMDGVNATRT